MPENCWMREKKNCLFNVGRWRVRRDGSNSRKYAFELCSRWKSLFRNRSNRKKRKTLSGEMFSNGIMSCCSGSIFCHQHCHCIAFVIITREDEGKSLLSQKWFNKYANVCRSHFLDAARRWSQLLFATCLRSGRNLSEPFNEQIRLRRLGVYD